MGIEYRYIAFTPQLLPSGHYPFMVFKHHGFFKWYNRITWKIARMLDKFNLTRLINNKRKEFGLKPVQDAWHHILGKKVVVASDRAIAQVPEDVDIPFTQTGYLHLNQPDQHLSKLETFLEEGSIPVFAGFGSMPKQDQAGLVPMIVQAARSVGQRVIIGKFWDEPSEFSNSKDVLFIRRYPHLKLFPRMAAVIHHGGSGTTATTVISGVPQIIVPHILDQYYWGHQVYHSHLGTKPIWRSKLTSQKLSAAIEECLSNGLIIQKSRAASEMINPQDSLDAAVREVLKSKG